MTKKHQQALIRWLKQQNNIISHYRLYISRLLGVLGGMLIIAQAWLISYILNYVIAETIQRKTLFLSFIMLMLVFILRALLLWLHEQVVFHNGQHIRSKIRCQILDKLAEAGPAWIQSHQIGSWITLILEQIDDMHDYYARYLPQITLAICLPILIIITTFVISWVAALILLFTAPLIPMFMALVGIGAADANRRNFLALSRLSSHFLDRLRGMETLRIFDQAKAETENIRLASQDFRNCTMEVLRLAFLSSGVLEFFTSLSIALVAIYFGFSYLGVLNFGHYSTPITFFAGLLVLILAPEFFRPLRDLGAFYHAKAQAIGAADRLKNFLETPLPNLNNGNLAPSDNGPVMLVAKDFSVLSPDGIILAGPLNFTLRAGQRVALVGSSGSGKSSLLNAISGFMAYTGSLRINGIELRALKLKEWRAQLSWVGQNPQLPAPTLRENVILGLPDALEDELQTVLGLAWIKEFLPFLPNGIDTLIGEQGVKLSVGQAQRVAVARALLRPCRLLLLDEPVASLDIHSERYVMKALNAASRRQTTLMVTHQIGEIGDWDDIWVMNNGRIVEQGNFTTLAAAHGHFASLLANRQLRDII